MRRSACERGFGREQRTEEGEPVAPEIKEQRRRGPQMHDDEIGQEIGRALVDRPAEQPRQNHRVAQAGDREQLGYALQDGHDDGLEGGHALNASRLDGGSEEAPQYNRRFESESAAPIRGRGATENAGEEALAGAKSVTFEQLT